MKTRHFPAIPSFSVATRWRWFMGVLALVAAFIFVAHPVLHADESDLHHRHNCALCESASSAVSLDAPCSIIEPVSQRLPVVAPFCTLVATPPLRTRDIRGPPA